MVIRKLSENEIGDAVELILRVFMQYEAPDYSAEGIETFKRTALYNKEYLSSVEMHGAYEKEKIIGVIATRNGGSHIALFFVDGKYHRKGIGRLLFEAVLEKNSSDELTVNSSPYAREVYHHLGFMDTAPEQLTDGIRYIPMRYKKNTSEVTELIAMLEDKDNSAAYKALQRLEQISEETGALYAYKEKFLKLISSNQYTFRVRGFRLFFRQAKWDKDNFLDENIDGVLHIFNDDKPTAVRQALTAVLDVVRYKPELREMIKRAVSEINYLRYKDTMHSLIAKDIQEVLELIKQLERE